MEIKKGDKVRVIADTIFSHKYPKGSEATVCDIDKVGIWLDEGADSNLFYENELELIEDNQEYLKLRGLDGVSGHADPAGEPGQQGVDGSIECPSLKPTDQRIAEECDNLKEMLRAKNRKYGNSALSYGVAFDISPVTALKARINDKISRLRNDNKDEDEDIILDLLGYFVLLRLAIQDESWKDKFREFMDDLNNPKS